MPRPTFCAEAAAGTSSADHVAGSAPSAWILNPNRLVFWLDQSTPILLPGRAVTTLMSSSFMPVATVIGPLNEEYGASL